VNWSCEKPQNPKQKNSSIAIHFIFTFYLLITKILQKKSKIRVVNLNFTDV